MTVGELIAMLRDHDPDLKVWIDAPGNKDDCAFGEVEVVCLTTETARVSVDAVVPKGAKVLSTARVTKLLETPIRVTLGFNEGP